MFGYMCESAPQMKGTKYKKKSRDNNKCLCLFFILMGVFFVLVVLFVSDAWFIIIVKVYSLLLLFAEMREYTINNT